MKKQTIIAKIRASVLEEIKVRDLEVVGGGRITISGSGSSIHAASGDAV